MKKWPAFQSGPTKWTFESIQRRFTAEWGNNELPDYVKVASVSAPQPNGKPSESANQDSNHSPFLVFDPDQKSPLTSILCNLSDSECTLPLPYLNTKMDSKLFFEKVKNPESDKGFLCIFYSFYLNF